MPVAISQSVRPKKPPIVIMPNSSPDWPSAIASPSLVPTAIAAAATKPIARRGRRVSGLFPC